MGLLLALAMPSAAQERSPRVALPLYAGGTESFISLDLGSGACSLTDRLKSDPRRIRARGLGQNLFTEIGRPTDQPAFAGEILLAPILGGDGSTRAAMFVETSTGYVAFLDGVGRGNRLGEISVGLGRPFEPIASMDGNYALLMRRDSAGRTDGAYLYHATTGRGFYYGGLRKLETVVEVAAVEGLPQLTGRVAAAAVQTTREQTVSYLIADGGSGELTFFDLSTSSPARIAVRKSPLSLTEVFPQPGPHPTPQRFVAVPILADDDRTRHVLIVDASSGALALVEGVDRQPVLRALRPNLYTTIGGDSRPGEATGQRVVTAVPGVASNGRTGGVWLVDSLTGAVVWLENPGFPGQASARRVTVGG